MLKGLHLEKFKMLVEKDLFILILVLTLFLGGSIGYTLSYATAYQEGFGSCLDLGMTIVGFDDAMRINIREGVGHIVNSFMGKPSGLNINFTK